MAELSELPTPNYEDYEMLYQIGDGSTAKVHAAESRSKVGKVAIKVVDLEKTLADLDEIRNELQIMQTCEHPNLVKYYTSFVHGRELHMVMELMDKGSMLDVISYFDTVTKGGVLDEPAIATVLKAVLQGLDYLHSNMKIHRDVKAGNILLNSSGEVKLADFGVSAFMGETAEDAFDRGAHAEVAKKKHLREGLASKQTFVGTPCWMAPEVMEQANQGYNQRADIWSLGITAIELATGTAPYADMPPLQVMTRILEQNPPSIEAVGEMRGQTYDKYKALGKFIRKCLEKDADKRPTAAELLKSDFIKKAKDPAFLVRELLDRLPKNFPQKKIQTTKKKPESRFQTAVSNWAFSGSAGEELQKVISEDRRRKMEEDRAAATIGAVPEGLPLNITSPPGVTSPGEPQPGDYDIKLRIHRKGSPETLEINFVMSIPGETSTGLAQELFENELILAEELEFVGSALDYVGCQPNAGYIFSLNGGDVSSPESNGADSSSLSEGCGKLLISRLPSEGAAQQAPSTASEPASAPASAPVPVASATPASAPASAPATAADSDATLGTESASLAASAMSNVSDASAYQPSPQMVQPPTLAGDAKYDAV